MNMRLITSRRSAPALKRMQLAALAFGTALVSAAGAEAAPRIETGFDKAFTTASEPARLHYKVAYEDAKGAHELEVWREGSRLKRTTDGVLETMVERGKQGELNITLRDERRRIITQVTRNSLYQIGREVDWFSMAHGLARPASSFKVLKLAASPLKDQGADHEATKCRWYELVQENRRSDVCWNAAVGLPTMIVAQPGNRIVWTLNTYDTKRIETSQFQLDSTGFVKVNADQDILVD